MAMMDLPRHLCEMQIEPENIHVGLFKVTFEQESGSKEVLIIGLLNGRVNRVQPIGSLTTRPLDDESKQRIIRAIRTQHPLELPAEIYQGEVSKLRENGHANPVPRLDMLSEKLRQEIEQAGYDMERPFSIDPVQGKGVYAVVQDA